MPGWVRIHRKLSRDDLWTSEKFTRGQAWVDLIMRASFHDGFARVRDVRIEYARGQVCASIKGLSDRWKWSQTKTKNFLKELEKDEQIIYSSSRVTTLITIVNYDDYQRADDQKDEQEMNRKGTGKEQERNKKGHSKKVKEGKEGKEGLKPLSPGDDDLQIILKDESLWPISEQDIADWTVLFPKINVIEVLRKVQRTCHRTPDKRKDNGSIRGHIVGCLKILNDGKAVFERTWARYPSKIGRKKAEASFRASVHTAEDLANIHQAMDNYLDVLAANPDRPVQNGATWFHNWRDWIEQPVDLRRAKGNGNGRAAAEPSNTGVNWRGDFPNADVRLYDD